MMTKNKRHIVLMMTLAMFPYSLVTTEALALDPQPLPVSKGVYRLPYTDGTDVYFVNDHTNHPAALNRVDLVGLPQYPDATHTVVSAAAGWIRRIQENNFTFCPDKCGPNNDCDGNGTTDNQSAWNAACQNYNGPAASCCEQDFEENGGTCPNGGTCQPSPNVCATDVPNNFVWIEHANGEWTKYTHLQTGSVSAAGRSVDEYVPAGTPLGLEGDIGYAGGVHCHFEVAVPYYVERLDQLDLDNLTMIDPEREPPTEEDFFCKGFLLDDFVQDDVLYEDKNNNGMNNPDDDVNRQNRIGVFCQVGFPVDNGSDTAVACDDACGNVSLDLVGTITPAASPRYEQVSGDAGNDTGDLVIQPFAGLSVRAGGTITLSPGFHAEGESFFVASIGACDTPGGTGE